MGNVPVYSVAEEEVAGRLSTDTHTGSYLALL